MISGLPSHVLENFEAIEYERGDFFLQSGNHCKKLGIVSAGLLRSYQIDKEGNDVTTNFFQENSFCGSYYSFYERQPSFENIVCLTPVQMYTISFARLSMLFKESFDVNFFGRVTIQNVCIEKDLRISKLLQLDAKDRYKWFLEKYPRVIESSPLKYIASYLNMNPGSLSRIRNELAR